MNTKSNIHGMVNRLTVALFAVVAIAGITAFVPVAAPASDSISLRSIKTDTSMNFKPRIESDAKVCPGAWFKEMVQPVGDERRLADYLRNTVS